MPPLPHRCWAEIDLSALKQNVRAIRQRLPVETCYISVVKADAYGLGAEPVVDALKSAGVGMFAVANVTEAAGIRRIERELPILLLSATLPGECDYLFEYNLTPTVSCVEEVDRYQEAAQRHGKTLPIHLKIDTGMGRLGIWHTSAAELLDAAAAAPLLQMRGIFSHFARADEDPEFTDLQRRRFLSIVERLEITEPLLVHIDNSAGLATSPPEGPFNAVRVGLLQFGVLPMPDSPLTEFDVSPALTFHSRISVVKDLPKGTGISYGSTRTLDRDSRVAVVTAGYADGIHRACSNRASFLVGEQRCPVLGTVTMDEIVLDVTDMPKAACGDPVTIIGRQGPAEITINEFSDWCDTIPWESLCAISKRVARVYL